MFIDTVLRIDVHRIEIYTCILAAAMCACCCCFIFLFGCVIKFNAFARLENSIAKICARYSDGKFSKMAKSAMTNYAHHNTN